MISRAPDKRSIRIAPAPNAASTAASRAPSGMCAAVVIRSLSVRSQTVAISVRHPGPTLLAHCADTRSTQHLRHRRIVSAQGDRWITDFNPGTYLRVNLRSDAFTQRLVRRYSTCKQNAAHVKGIRCARCFDSQRLDNRLLERCGKIGNRHVYAITRRPMLSKRQIALQCCRFVRQPIRIDNAQEGCLKT